MELGADCGYDAVIINDAAGNLQRYCGTSIPLPYISTTGTVEIRVSYQKHYSVDING